MTKSGMTLLEIAIYLFLSMLSLTLASSLIISLVSSARHATEINETALELSIALHHLAEDLKCAQYLKELGNTSCIMATSAGDIGYVAKQGNLMRYSGLYTHSTKTWSRRSSSLLAYGLDKIRFRYSNSQDNVHEVHCQLVKRNQSYELYQGIS